ncbi:MAG TPA: hypothetical protein VN894_16675 [Polyangiaceae bacterium]|nr:hypothetical protein [Polyangiaceae bacterium]
MWIRRLFELALAAGLVFAAGDAHSAPSIESDHAQADDDPLAAYRERFKRGMERYQAGAIAEAIGYWEPVYRELGEQKGYRLAYNLGVAYQELGDATQAAERLQAFLDEVDVLRQRGDDLPPIVERESGDARARVARLIETRGRIHVEALGAPRTARVDAAEPRLAGFVAWVTPGDHTVTFAEGTPDAETHSMHIRAGEIVEIAPRPPPTPPPPPEPVIVNLLPPPPPPVATHRETFHPFRWQLIAVTGGVALAAGIAAVPLYAYEGDLYARYAGENPRPKAHSDAYNSGRTLAYTDVGGAVGFATMTAALATWYFLGASDREINVAPTVGPEPGGASLGVNGRF